MNIQIQIERLVLDGIDIPPAQRPRLQAALEAELTQLLTDGGLGAEWRSSRAMPRLAGLTVQLPADSSPTQWGQQIAQAIYRGIR